jgi:hypothetical protein
MLKRPILLPLGLCFVLSAQAAARTWSDSTGYYRVEADLIGFSETTVVLKKEKDELVAVPIARLSQEDRAYVQSKEAAEHSRRSADVMQTWTMASGLKVVGKVVDYGRREITVQRRRGKTYVNERLLDNLPEIYQRMLPKIVEHFEKTEIEDARELDSWVMGLRGKPRMFTCEGVILELENGDEYAVPFFLFSEDDLRVLRPGSERGLAGGADPADQEQESFLLQAQAQAYQQDRRVNQQIAVMQFQMQG